MPYLDKEKVDEKTRTKLEALIEKSYFGYWKKKRLFDIFFATLFLALFVAALVGIFRGAWWHIGTAVISWTLFNALRKEIKQCLAEN